MSQPQRIEPIEVDSPTRRDRAVESATAVPHSATRGQTPPDGVRPRVSFRCPVCGGADVGIEAGNEFEVESIEVEEPACTG